MKPSEKVHRSTESEIITSHANMRTCGNCNMTCRLEDSGSVVGAAGPLAAGLAIAPAHRHHGAWQRVISSPQDPPTFVTM